MRVVLVDQSLRIRHECRVTEDHTQAILWHGILMNRSKHSSNGYVPAIEFDGQLFVGDEVDQMPSGRMLAHA